jgi:hypothetical protein
MFPTIMLLVAIATWKNLEHLFKQGNILRSFMGVYMTWLGR